MKKIVKNATLFLPVLLFLTSMFPVASYADTSSYTPQLQVSIPGAGTLNFQTVSCTPGQSCSIEWLGQYIGALYNFGVAFAAILAAVMIMAGGFLWLTSAGDSGRVGKAKEFIVAALSGLFLALFSYLLLAAVNPKLVNLQGLSILQPSNVSSPDASAVTHDQVFPPSTNVLSSTGAQMTQQFEGLILTAYDDHGHRSIGYGHQIDPGETITRVDPVTGQEVKVPLDGATLTPTEADTLFIADYREHEQQLLADFPEIATVNSDGSLTLNPNVSQARFDALVDATFNLGSFSEFPQLSASLDRAIQYGDASDWGSVADNLIYHDPGNSTAPSGYAQDVPAERSGRIYQILYTGQ